MLDFLDIISNTIIDIVNTIVALVTSVQNLNNKIAELTFDSTNAIYSFFSTLRYVTGDVIYLTMTSIVILGMTFVLVKISKTGVNFVLGFIPGFNIKLP